MSALILTTPSGLNVAVFGPHTVEERNNPDKSLGLLVVIPGFETSNRGLSYPVASSFAAYARQLTGQHPDWNDSPAGRLAGLLARQLASQHPNWIDLRPNLSFTIGAVVPSSLLFTAEGGSEVAVTGPFVVEQARTVQSAATVCAPNQPAAIDVQPGLIVRVPNADARRIYKIPELEFSSFIAAAIRNNHRALDLRPAQTTAKANKALRDCAANHPAP